MNLDSVPTRQGKAIRPGRIQRDTGTSLVERIDKGNRSPRLRSEPQVRETLFPAPPGTRRGEDVTPRQAENLFVEIRTKIIDSGGLADHPLVHHVLLSRVIQVEPCPF